MGESREGKGELQREVRGLHLKRVCHPQGQEDTRCHIESIGVPNLSLVSSMILVPGTVTASKHVPLFSLSLILTKHLVYAENCFRSLNVLYSKCLKLALLRWVDKCDCLF